MFDVGRNKQNAVTALKKDDATLFTFYHYPARHWQHILSTNPIESAFSTVRLRTQKTRGAKSRE